MKKLSQLPIELRKEVTHIKNDEEISNLGFICKGMLCEYEGYENFYERLWVWVKTENDKVYIVITADSGNCFCDIAYTDMYVKDVINEIN